MLSRPKGPPEFLLRLAARSATLSESTLMDCVGTASRTVRQVGAGRDATNDSTGGAGRPTPARLHRSTGAIGAAANHRRVAGVIDSRHARLMTRRSDVAGTRAGPSTERKLQRYSKSLVNDNYNDNENYLNLAQL